LSEAEHAFARALDLAPDLAQPYLNLGHLLEKRGDAFQAVVLYERAIARGLDSGSFSHHVAAALGKPAKRAPDSWVRATFDNFAPTFDAHLQALEYDAPRRLARMLHAHVAAPVDILDLGCGTGQCGVALAGVAKRLTGVDLSEKMLAQARVHGVYDELCVREIGEWLADAASGHFDVVVAADVFIYIGELEGVFREVARTLRPGGWFAFSIEETADAAYTLQHSGRFAQSQAYIARLAEGKFAEVAAEPTVIRKESGAALPGRLYVMRKHPAASDSRG
jgi:predicted TPR repeat methyltransferase